MKEFFKILGVLIPWVLGAMITVVVVYLGLTTHLLGGGSIVIAPLVGVFFLVLARDLLKKISGH